MEEIIKGLWLGSDKDVPEAKKRGYARLTVAKDGPDGHRAMLGYTTLGAPKDKDYLWARQGEWLALNCLDLDDPEFISDKMINVGLAFIKEMQDKGKKILVHCNAGHSRGPTMVLMYLRAIGELPQGFVRAEHVFRTIYPSYDPGIAMRAHARERWKSLPELYGKRS